MADFFKGLSQFFFLRGHWQACCILARDCILYICIFKTFKLKYYRPLIIPFTLIIFSLSLIPESLMEIMYLDNKVIRYYAWIVAFGLPFVLLSIARAC